MRINYIWSHLLKFIVLQEDNQPCSKADLVAKLCSASYQLWHLKSSLPLGRHQFSLSTIKMVPLECPSPLPWVEGSRLLAWRGSVWKAVPDTSCRCFPVSQTYLSVEDPCDNNWSGPLLGMLCWEGQSLLTRVEPIPFSTTASFHGPSTNLERFSVPRSPSK